MYFLEFFEDNLLRKMTCEPEEYVRWPAALKLFYEFLSEKGYLEGAEGHVGIIDTLEPSFMEILRRQFG
jgi:hypothetical protein